jgi:hypothetical protein
MDLNPVQVTQPTSVDIYPGRSGTPALANWNNFVLTAPSADQARAIYNQGRNDAVSWVRDAFPRSGANSFSAAALQAALGATGWP